MNFIRGNENFRRRIKPINSEFVLVERRRLICHQPAPECVSANCEDGVGGFKRYFIAYFTNCFTKIFYSLTVLFFSDPFAITLNCCIRNIKYINRTFALSSQNNHTSL